MKDNFSGRLEFRLQHPSLFLSQYLINQIVYTPRTKPGSSSGMQDIHTYAESNVPGVNPSLSRVDIWLSNNHILFEVTLQLTKHYRFEQHLPISGCYANRVHCPSIIASRGQNSKGSGCNMILPRR